VEPTQIISDFQDSSRAVARRFSSAVRNRRRGSLPLTWIDCVEVSMILLRGHDHRVTPRAIVRDYPHSVQTALLVRLLFFSGLFAGLSAAVIYEGAVRLLNAGVAA
jgi:hypothetical protein